ncbi:hypothetical protein SLA2020_486400 [Shorea laevis]
MGKTTTSRDWSQIYAIYGVEQWQTLSPSPAEPLDSPPDSPAPSPPSPPYASYCRRELLLLRRATPPRHGPPHAVRRRRLVHGEARPRPRLRPGNPPQRRGDPAEEGGQLRRVVGLDRSKTTTLRTLRTAKLEGVGEYVTCREGDVRRLPFADNSFDVVVSGVFLHTVGKEHGRHRTVEAAAERMRVVGEVVRVLKPGGVGVVWDLMHVPEYARRLQDLKMEEIRVSERVTAFMVSSHIVSFRKPRQHVVGPAEVRLDWRC